MEMTYSLYLSFQYNQLTEDFLKEGNCLNLKSMFSFSWDWAWQLQRVPYSVYTVCDCDNYVCQSLVLLIFHLSLILADRVTGRIFEWKFSGFEQRLNRDDETDEMQIKSERAQSQTITGKYLCNKFQ